MKTTNEIIRDSAIYLKDEIIVINDNDKKWFTQEEMRKAFILGLNNGSENNFKELIQ